MRRVSRNLPSFPLASHRRHPVPHPHPFLRTFQHACTVIAAILLFLIAASYIFRHDLYTSSTNSGHTIGLIRGRFWLAHLPNMPSAAIDAWWAARGASDRPVSFDPWPHRETVGPDGWAFALPLWIPISGALALASTTWCAMACRRRTNRAQ